MGGEFGAWRRIVADAEPVNADANPPELTIASTRMAMAKADSMMHPVERVRATGPSPSESSTSFPKRRLLVAVQREGNAPC